MGSKWKVVVEFFNSFNEGDIILRDQYMSTVGKDIGQNMADLYRCYLQRSGYLFDFPRGHKYYGRGIYFLSSKIKPQDKPMNQVRKMAYGK